MNIRPVRLVPLAAGANPTIGTEALRSPNAGPGRPSRADQRKRRGAGCEQRSRAIRPVEGRRQTDTRLQVRDVLGLVRKGGEPRRAIEQPGWTRPGSPAIRCQAAPGVKS